MEVLRSHLKLGVSLLICGTVLACTCAAYDTEVRHTWNRLLRAAGFGAVPRYVVTRETIVAAGDEVKVDGRRVTVTKVPAEALTQRPESTRRMGGLRLRGRHSKRWLLSSISTMGGSW